MRFKGTEAEWKEKLQDAFGTIEVVNLAEGNDEFAFVTEVMSEGAYESAAANFSQICQMIRVK